MLDILLRYEQPGGGSFLQFNFRPGLGAPFRARDRASLHTYTCHTIFIYIYYYLVEDCFHNHLLNQKDKLRISLRSEITANGLQQSARLRGPVELLLF